MGPCLAPKRKDAIACARRDTAPSPGNKSSAPGMGCSASSARGGGVRPAPENRIPRSVPPALFTRHKPLVTAALPPMTHNVVEHRAGWVYRYHQHQERPAVKGRAANRGGEPTVAWCGRASLSRINALVDRIDRKAKSPLVRLRKRPNEQNDICRARGVARRLRALPAHAQRQP